MYDNDYYSRPTQAVASMVNSTMKRVYLKMTLALIVTAFTALWASTSAGYINFYITHSWLMWVLLIAEFGLVFAISGAINRLSSVAATGLFYLFAVINGLMLCTIFLVYSPAAITKTFFITAGTFGAMSIYGYTTSSDLSKIGSYLFMALIGLIIASLVNIFVHSSTLDWIVPAEAAGKLATIGALSLYLDFINLFLYLLRIFGNSDR